MTDPSNAERVIDVAEIELSHRHAIICQLSKHHLDPGNSLLIVVDHDPRRLRIHLDFAFRAQYEWLYLEQGPDVWCIRLRHVRTGAGTGLKNAGRLNPTIAPRSSTKSPDAPASTTR
jgi:uncharacterized protein (DUF2249 family)